jgi:hypothetical protein
MAVRDAAAQRTILESRVAAGDRIRIRESAIELERRAEDHGKRKGGPIVMMSICQTQGLQCQVTNGSQSYMCVLCGWVYR